MASTSPLLAAEAGQVDEAMTKPSRVPLGKVFSLVGAISLVAGCTLAFSHSNASPNDATSLADTAKTFKVFVVRHDERKWAELQHCHPADYGYPSGINEMVDICQPGGADEACGGRYLVPNGYARAVCEAERSEELFGSDIRQIYAQYNPKCDEGASLREVQTMYPLSKKLGIEMNKVKLFSRDGEKPIADHVYNSISADVCGGEVVIAWDHSMLDTLLSYMGCTEEYCTTKWHVEDYWHYIEFIFSCAEGDEPVKLVSVRRRDQHVCDNLAYDGTGNTKPHVSTKYHGWIHH
jgi:hypothetical protein